MAGRDSDDSSLEWLLDVDSTRSSKTSGVKRDRRASETRESVDSSLEWMSNEDQVDEFSELDSSHTCGLDLDETLEEDILHLDDSDLDANDNSDNQQNDDDKSDYKKPSDDAERLYKDSRVSVFQTYLMIFQFVLKHHLTGNAISDLLLLLKVLLPQASQLPKSVYLLKRFFLKAFPNLKVVEHKYCDNCHMPIIDSELDECPNPQCTCDNVSRFITVPVGPQLKQMMEDPSIWSTLQERFKRPTSVNIRDVYDGQKYREHNEFLCKNSHVSLVINTDGVAIFHSSKVSVWPVWIVVNEIPKHQRFLRKNMLLAGMWYSKQKPTMTTFLKPVLDEINDLYHNGMDVVTPDGVKKMRCMVLMSSLDLPARAIVLNMKQFNGKYGCSFCVDTGAVEVGRPLHRWWPPSLGVARTHQSVLQNAQTATSTTEASEGVFGASVLCIHPPFDLAVGCVVDNLHSLYLGVTLMLLKLWFTKNYKKNDYSLFKQISTCQLRLQSITVPDVMSRTPKSLHDLHWKGSELQAWALYFSLPVLNGILPLVYFRHWSLLVGALHILSSDCITPADLDKSHDLLKDFYQLFPDLYGEKKCTMNVHLLSHVAECVRNWGPIWCYSCFPFESRNGDLKKLFHGSRDMSRQLIPRMVAESPVSEVEAVQNVLFGSKVNDIKLYNRYMDQHDLN